jgi:hypothetical protein
MNTNSFVSPSTARWNNYGVGWPGTQGIPSLALSAPPVIGTTFNMVVQNVNGRATFGVLVWGFAPANTPSIYGGAYQVSEIFELTLGMIPEGLFPMPIEIPRNGGFVGLEFHVQVLQVDGNASHGVAFTPGLYMVLGL